MTITFGDWRLVPYDRRNWRLEHRHVPARSTDGKAKWLSRDRYYQSLGQALKDVYEIELREADGDLGLAEAIARAEQIEQRLRGTVACG